MAEHDPEDLKLVTLARSARARNGADTAAAVRDDTGRTYVATPVALASLSLGAVQAAVAAAVSSGARRLEAVVVVGSSAPDHDAVAVGRELAAPGARMLVAAADGTITDAIALA